MSDHGPMDIVCVAPHPDDAELCCGGLLLGARKAGLSVGIIDCTRGEMATRGSVETRAREAAAADRLLGTAVRLNLGLADGGLEDNHALHRPLVAALRQLLPRVVLAPHWEDQHPDHAAVGQAIAKSAWLCGAPKYHPESAGGVASIDSLPYRPELVLHYQNRYGIQADMVVDITDVYERKLELARCYATQFGPAPTGSPGEPEPQTKLSSQAFFDWFRALHATYGFQIGVTYGEPYCLKGPVPVRSLGDFWRSLV